jgi:hypothetical protein
MLNTWGGFWFGLDLCLAEFISSPQCIFYALGAAAYTRKRNVVDKLIIWAVRELIVFPINYLLEVIVIRLFENGMRISLVRGMSTILIACGLILLISGCGKEKLSFAIGKGRMQ